VTTVHLAVRTTDTAWAAEHGATRGTDGRWLVPVPADAREAFTFCGRSWYRVTFRRAPSDARGQTVLAAPAAWCDAP
jgi:hypothetical protein